jgi:small subunit ribosomal protein S1
VGALPAAMAAAGRSVTVTTTPYPFGAAVHMTSSIEDTSSATGGSATGAANQVTVDDLDSEEAFLAAIDETIKYFNDGDIVEGTVVKVDRDEVLLDIGYKTEGVIPSRELSIKHDVDPADVVKVGDRIEALVLQKEDKEGRLILSKKRAQYERAWGTIEKIKEEDGVVRGSVIEVVKGGLILDIGLRGFLPASLVEMRRVRDLQPYVNRELEAKIIELDKNRNNVVLSRRAWLEQTQSEVRTEFLNKLAKGQVRKGVVSSIVNFGAFVDLGGVDGLVHVSELSWKHIDHPSEVVEVGQEVEVEVLSVEMDRERVSLSLKATQEDPWRQFARTHAIQQIVPGKVTKLVPFGAFVRVEDGIEGLVHISELAEKHVEIPEQVVQVGSDVMVKVIDIDLERRRISLSLKQANEGFLEGEEHFDPTLYGMAAEYDENGNYKYPEGFDPETGEWLPGFEAQRDEWERQYAAARTRWEAHTRQVQNARAVAEEASAGGESTGESAGGSAGGAARKASEPAKRRPEPAGTLATDEALAALKEKLAGN